MNKGSYLKEEDSVVQKKEKIMNDGQDKKIDENSHLFHIFRLIVFLYEDLRSKLIKIIDENLNIDEILTQEYIDLIYRQQDIIDEYLKIFNLKKNIDLEVDPKNVDKFLMDSKNNDFLNKNFDVNNQNGKKTTTKKKVIEKEEYTKLLQKIKMEREIVEQRIQELKEYM